MSLGYAPGIIVATGGPTNPVGIAVTIGAGVAWVASKFLNIGAGRNEADYLTDPETGAQTHAGHAMVEIANSFWAQPEAWTDDFVSATVSALRKIGTDFETYASQFSRAGPGAINTIWYWLNRVIADIESVPRIAGEIIDILPEPEADPEPEPVTDIVPYIPPVPIVPVVPRRSIIRVNTSQADDNTIWVIAAIGAALLLGGRNER